MQKFLTGRTAVVTGAARGLGRAMAVALGEAGANVALVDVLPLDATLNAIRASGAQASAHQIDVSVEANIAQLEQDVAKQFGSAQILVNAAGIVIRKRVTDMSPEEWNRLLAINLTACFLLSRAFVPHMQKAKWGRIINITSVMAHVSTPERGAYSASKAGLLALTKTLATDLAADGISAVAISPGAFATEMTAALREDPARNSAILAATPAKRWGTPEEIGELARYLCSDAASFINGTDIVIDGGWMALA